MASSAITPSPSGGSSVNTTVTDHTFYSTGPKSGHIAFTAMSLVSLAFISTLFGLRLKSLGFNSIKGLQAMTPIRFIVAAVYICAMILLFSVGIMLNGVGLDSFAMCRLGIYLCFAFYVCGLKVLMYLFMVERAHLVRAANHRRLRDRFWWVGILIVLFGFGTISTFAFISPAYVKPSSHGCMMGLPPSLLVPLLVYDIMINTLLTLLFVYFLLQLLKFRGGFRHNRCALCRAMHKLLGFEAHPSMEVLEMRPLQSASAGPFTNQLESLIKRSLAAALLLMFPTILNLTILLKYNGFEEGWACFISCSFDVTWSVAVVHWLTTSETSASPPQRPALTRSTTSGTTVIVKTGTTKIPEVSSSTAP